MNRFRVAITVRSFDYDGPAMADLLQSCDIVSANRSGRRLAETDLPDALRDSQGVIAGTEPFTRDVFAGARALRVISRVGVGTDSIDLAAARERGIRVFTTPDAATQAVAEHTLALTLAVLKRIGLYTLSRQGEEVSTPPGILLSGKTAGIIGLGRIGHRVATMLECLGCRIMYHDPAPGRDPRTGWTAARDLPDLLGQADVLTLHAPAQDGGKPLLGAGELALCRQGAIIINTARGTLIDEDALVSGLLSGHIAGAGLDVFAREPYRGPLLAFPQVVTTPHVASHTVESRREMEREAAANLLRGLAEVQG